MPKFLFSMLIAVMVALCPYLTDSPRAGEYGSSGKFDFVKHKKKPMGIHVPSDAHTQSYRTEYIQKSEKLSSEGKNAEACALIHKLSELILKKSDEMSREEWIFAYAQFYREAISLRNLYKTKIERTLKITSSKSFEKAMKIRKTKGLQFKNPIEIKCKGSLSSDGRIYLSSENSPYRNKIPISAYDVNAGKLWEEIPVPDDKKNPQIKRWGRALKTKMPKWSPDGQKYAYILNGALCVSSAEKSEIISSIKDSYQENDISFEWSLDGSSIAYIRNIGGIQYAFLNKLSPDSDIKIAKADSIIPSADGNQALYTSEGSIYIYTRDGAKNRKLSTGFSPVFSTDGKKVLFVSGKNSIKSISINGGNETELINLKSKDISSIASLSPDRLAFTIANSGDLMILYKKDKAEILMKNAGEINQSFPNSQYLILCKNKAIKFGQ